jgi:hypothetical protein
MKTENKFLNCSEVEEKLAEIIFDDFEDSKDTFLLHQHTKKCKNCSRLLNQMKVSFGLITDKFERKNMLTLSSKNKKFLEQLSAGKEISNPSRRIKLHNIQKRQYNYPSTGRIAAAIAIIVISIQVLMLMEPKTEIRITKNKVKASLPKGFIAMKIDTENVDQDGYRIDSSKDYPDFSVAIKGDTQFNNKLFDVQINESENNDTQTNHHEINENDHDKISSAQIAKTEKKLVDNHQISHFDLDSNIPTIKQKTHAKENINSDETYNNDNAYLIAHNKNKQIPTKEITILSTFVSSYDKKQLQPNKYIPQFTNTESNSLSSFPVYTGGKSYRQFTEALSQGEIPKADIIKPEEFINAFDYHIKEPNNKRYSLQTNFLKSPYTDSHIVLRVALKSNSKMAPITDFAIQLEFNSKSILKYRKIGYDTESTHKNSQNHLSPKHLNTVALYEIELAPNRSVKDNFLTIRTLYRDTLNNKINNDRVIVSKPLSLPTKTIDSHPRLYQPLFLAEFSNYLREKAHPNTNYAQLVKHAHSLLKSFPEETEIRTLYKHVQQYRKLKNSSVIK